MWRLSPNVNVVTTSATANTDPSSAERTGTAARPSPGSSAIRTPTTPGADSPARAADATTRAPDVVRSRGRSAIRCGAVAYASRAAVPPRTVDQREEAEAENGPVPGQAAARIHGSDGAEW